MKIADLRCSCRGTDEEQKKNEREGLNFFFFFKKISVNTVKYQVEHKNNLAVQFTIVNKGHFESIMEKNDG